MQTATSPIDTRSQAHPLAAHQVLRGVDLFTALDDKELRRLADFTRQRHCPRGETLLLENDAAGDHLFVVAEGEVSVTLDGGEGKETILALLKEGDFFGEMSLVDGSPRAATVRATETTRLISLRREDFRKALRENPDLSWTLLTELSNRLRHSNRKVSCLAHQKVAKRVASALAQLFEERGIRLRDEKGRRCVLLRHRPTQQHIAEMAGTSRETVSRLISAWERAGWLRDEGRDLFLLDEEALQALQ